MDTAHFNSLVMEAARHQHLPSHFAPGAGGTIGHRWKTDAQKAEVQETKQFDFGINPLTGLPYFSAWVFSKPGKSTANRLWQVTVGPGSVNDEPACMEYLAGADPRGWIMPQNYGPYAKVTKVFGPGYRFVDRPLTDAYDDSTGAPPFLYLLAPTADLSDLGGFSRTSDRRRPEFFRTADAWEKQLYQASVMVTVSPYRADPTAVSLNQGGARARRWRVTAGLPPTAVEGAGVAKIASCEVARIWLLRTPGKPELDEVEVQQIAYWNLWARSSIDLRFLELLGLSAAVLGTLDIGLLALGLTGILASELFVGIEEAVIYIILENLEAIIAATSSVQFWSV